MWIVSFLEFSSKDVHVFSLVFLLLGQVGKKEPYICSSTFDHVAGHLRGSYKHIKYI